MIDTTNDDFGEEGNASADGHDINNTKLKRKSDEKFCAYCGRVLHISAISCPQCGAAQNVLPTVQTQQFSHVSTTGPDNILQPRMHFCSGCGKPLHVDAVQCPHCGAPHVRTGKKQGSVFWLIAWVIFFWPVAILYYFSRNWKN